RQRTGRPGRARRVPLERPDVRRAGRLRCPGPLRPLGDRRQWTLGTGRRLPGQPGGPARGRDRGSDRPRGRRRPAGGGLPGRFPALLEARPHDQGGARSRGHSRPLRDAGAGRHVRPGRLVPSECRARRAAWPRARLRRCACLPGGSSVRPPPARRGLARFHRPRAALGRLRSLGEAGGRRVLKREGRLLALGLVLALLFAADALAATVWTRLPLDLEITRTVQGIPWGARVAAFLGVGWAEGVRQAILGVAVVTAVFLFTRRAALWAFASFLSGGAYYVVQLLVARPRPPASLVHVVRHASGHSFPSGHLTFFTWVAADLVLAFVPGPPRAPAWAVAGARRHAVAIPLPAVQDFRVGRLGGGRFDQARRLDREFQHPGFAIGRRVRNAHPDNRRRPAPRHRTCNQPRVHAAARGHADDA